MTGAGVGATGVGVGVVGAVFRLEVGPAGAGA
jgi:hypothetical protein